MRANPNNEVSIETILVVDDKPENLFAMKSVLKPEGYRVLTASSGDEALKTVATEDVSLLLLDVQMPQMDGYEVAEILSSNEQTSDIPIIFLTAQNADKDDVTKGLQAGAIDYLTKPVDPTILRMKISNYCMKHQQYVKSKLALQALQKTNESLESYVQQVEASIIYAKTIQQSVLPKEDILKQVFPESFICFKPRDIVSGDFYWFTIKHGKAIIAAVDCTGHGVSGALLSMIGNDLLNQVVNEKNLTRPSDILTELSNGIIKTFNHNTNGGEATEGMDIAICAFDLDMTHVEFAGAKHPMYLVRDKVLKEIKGDYVEIGNNSPLNQQFTNHSVQLQKGDTIYLSSDGYPDQFGGARNRKFMASNFEALLAYAAGKPMDEQQQLLETTLNNWMNGHWQVDDILVMGIRVPG